MADQRDRRHRRVAHQSHDPAQPATEHEPRAGALRRAHRARLLQRDATFTMTSTEPASWRPGGVPCGPTPGAALAPRCEREEPSSMTRAVSPKTRCLQDELYGSTLPGSRHPARRRRGPIGSADARSSTLASRRVRALPRGHRGGGDGSSKSRAAGFTCAAAPGHAGQARRRCSVDDGRGGGAEVRPQRASVDVHPLATRRAWRDGVDAG